MMFPDRTARQAVTYLSNHDIHAFCYSGLLLLLDRNSAWGCHQAVPDNRFWTLMRFSCVSPAVDGQPASTTHPFGRADGCLLAPPGRALSGPGGQWAFELHVWW